MSDGFGNSDAELERGDWECMRKREDERETVRNRVTVESLTRKTVVIDENGVPDWSTIEESKTNGGGK